ncbi:hypothetical protein GQ44DRAFT_491014 [Phaeosphaeriaceae sp. PMI808]|nr:hypothetical protein GQ44DRAFT_491014 [Phaeosphaeriaceae sp. PMI808]
MPLPPTLIPPITPAHLSCYTSHRHNIWSNNAFQPMGCMICLQNERDPKWCCTWCQLRICVGCSEELSTVPGRDLGRLIERMEQGGMMMRGAAADVLSDVDEGDEDFA